MTNARTFSLELDNAYDKLLAKQFLPFKQKIALEVLQRVTQKMPVDQGRARGNTVVSLNSTSSEVSETTDKTGGATVAKGSNTIFSDKNPFGAVFIQNNLPYINRLENGYSQQAPIGMFAVTVEEIKVMFA